MGHFLNLQKDRKSRGTRCCRCPVCNFLVSRVSPLWVPHAHLPELPWLEVRSGHGRTPVLFVSRLDMPGMASDGRGQQVSARCPWTQAQFQCVLHSFEGPKRGGPSVLCVTSPPAHSAYKQKTFQANHSQPKLFSERGLIKDKGVSLMALWAIMKWCV